MPLRAVICSPQPHLARAVSLQLLRSDFSVWTTPTADAALQRILTFHPDLLVVDMDAPGLDAGRLISEARMTAAENLQVIGLVSRSESSAKAGVDEVDAIVAKPFSLRQFRAATSELGERRELLAAAH